MAQDPQDKVTKELFSPATIEQIVNALHTQLAVFKRRANSEKNPAIRAIIDKDIAELNNTINRIQGI